jgi:DNA-binding Xre family transcriptional regulator
MLIFNPRRVFALRGINNPLTYMIKNGFGRGTANNLLNFNNRSVKTEHVERLCLLLQCTPNDLHEWRPGRDAVVADDHPLAELRRDRDASTLAELARDLPLEKLNKIGEFLVQLKD